MNRKSIDQIVCTAAVAVLFIGGTPLRAVAFDQSFEAALKQTYVYRTYLKDDDIKVATEDGVVTLTGTVADKSNWMLEGDASTTAMVRSALLPHRSINKVNMHVVTRNGIVMLTGLAGTDAEKELATELVGNINGVISVNNEMTIQVSASK